MFARIRRDLLLTGRTAVAPSGRFAAVNWSGMIAHAIDAIANRPGEPDLPPDRRLSGRPRVREPRSRRNAHLPLLGPVAEELLFRGLLLGWLRRWRADITAILLTAALFALAHTYHGPRMTITLVIGAVLGWARVRSGGLLAPIVLHVLVNGLVFANNLR